MRTVMRSQLTIAFGAIGLLIATLLVSGCKRHDYRSDGSFIDIRLTVANSPGEIEGMFREVLAGRYEDPTKGLTLYRVSNSNSHFVFLQTFNYPRGLAVFSLYCYEQTEPSQWRLRAFVPVNDYYFTNDDTKTLRFDVEGQNVNTIYRGSTILTVASIRSDVPRTAKIAK